MDGARPHWLDDDHDEDPPRDVATGGGRRRLRLLAAAAALPWLLVGALVLRDDAPVPAVDAHAGHHPAAVGTAVGPDGGLGAASAPSAPDLGEDVAGPPPYGDATGPEVTPGAGVATLPPFASGPVARTGPADGELAALATVVARAWVTGVDPVLAVDGIAPAPGGGYAEHLAVESIERPDADTAVVTLWAVVLEPEDTGLVATTRRLAVPLLLTPDGPRPGTPWWLPAPEPRATRLDGVAVEDPELYLAATDALVVAGYDHVEVISLRRTDGWPWIAEVNARTPDGTAVDGPVWLREHLGALVVVGMSPHPASPDVVEEEPS